MRKPMIPREIVFRIDANRVEFALPGPDGKEIWSYNGPYAGFRDMVASGFDCLKPFMSDENFEIVLSRFREIVFDIDSQPEGNP